MKFSLACNFDPRLLDEAKKYPVYEVYGKLTSDILGGGRASFMLPQVNKRKLSEYVKQTHDAGIGFNYLINAACLDNMEYSRSGQRKIRKLLDWLSECEVDSVTLNHAFLLKMIKKSYPHFRTRVGVFSAINSVQRAKFWEQEGADCLCLEDLSCNREFELLRSIRRGVSCDLQLLVNNSCFYSCALSQLHMNMLSHASQASHSSGGFYIDYCFLRCAKEKLENPVNYIRATWIRPEDLHIYEEIGITNFKIVERNSPTSLLALRLKAYAERSYDGNLLDLVQPYAAPAGSTEGNKDEVTPHPLYTVLRYFLRPFKVNPFQMLKLKKLSEAQGMLSPLQEGNPVQIPNKSLDGFLKRFTEEGCRDKDCDECRYCHTIAEKTVQVKQPFQQKSVEGFDAVFQEMESGSFWGEGKRG